MIYVQGRKLRSGNGKRQLTMCITGMKYPNITIVFAEQNTKNLWFFSTCGSLSFFLSVPILSRVCSSLSFALLTGRYKAEHKPHIKNRPAIPRMAPRQPKALSSA